MSLFDDSVYYPRDYQMASREEMRDFEEYLENQALDDEIEDDDDCLYTENF